jgi:hypothetical protein
VSKEPTTSIFLGEKLPVEIIGKNLAAERKVGFEYDSTDLQRFQNVY